MSFEQACKVIFEDEGEYSEDDQPTKWGIILADLKALKWDINGDGVITYDDVKMLTKDQAKIVYQKEYWEKFGLDRIKDEPIQIKTFENYVNMGPLTPNIILQRGIRSCGAHITEDGKIGPITIKALNTLSPNLLLVAIKSETAGVYRSMYQAKPVRYKKFIAGWLNRAYR